MNREVEVDQNGLYGVCVFNAENTTDDEIQDIFGKFGEIASSHRVNNLLFVRYSTYEDATNCLQSMRNNNTFKVRPAKKKNGDNTQRNQDNPTWSNKNETMNRNSVGNGNSQERRQALRDSYFRGKENGGLSSPCMPDLIPVFPEIKEDKSKPAPSIAKCIVIGNLPPMATQSQVYELCTKAKAAPLHVEMRQMKPLKYRTIMYAYVYVKSDKDVGNIVEGLNTLSMDGYHLIVSTADKLADEGEQLVNDKNKQ